MAEYYQHSGRVPPAGALATLVVGAAGAAVLGVIYSFAVVWIPFVYLNFLFTLGFGVITGIAVASLGQTVKIRNSTVLVVIGLLAMAVGYYVCWGADVWSRGLVDLDGDTLSAWNPSVIKFHLDLFYAHGDWAVGRGKGTTVSGIFLAVVWLIEAGIIFGMAGIGVLSITGDSTFCEECDCWSKKKENLTRFGHVDENLLRSALEQGEYSQLAARPVLADGVENYLRVDAFICPSCNEHCCINVVKHATTFNNKKEKETSDTTMVDRLVLDAGGLRQLLAATAARPAPAGESMGPADDAVVGPPSEIGAPAIGPPPTIGIPSAKPAPGPPQGPIKPNSGGIGPPPGFNG